MNTSATVRPGTQQIGKRQSNIGSSLPTENINLNSSHAEKHLVSNYGQNATAGTTLSDRQKGSSPRSLPFGDKHRKGTASGYRLSSYIRHSEISNPS